MKTLKLACWNVEWMDHLWPDLKSSKYHIDRHTHVADEINEIGADVMCIEEGASKPADMRDYVNQFLPDYRLAARPDGEGWGIKGQQWIYFIVKPNVVDNARLMPIDEWYQKADKKWSVHYWGNVKEYEHRHYRLPQVLRFDWEVQEIEVVGAHLKSKINFGNHFEPGTEEWKSDFVEDALKARIKLATEAANMCQYLDGRFVPRRPSRPFS
jgi:hypothetical protein